MELGRACREVLMANTTTCNLAVKFANSYAMLALKP